VLSAAAAGGARAESAGATNPAAPASASTDETSSRAYSTSNALDDAESGNPNSVDYPNRPISKHSSTNDELSADEIGSPYSVDYRNRPITSDPNWKSDWDFLESGNPHSAQPGEDTALEGQAEAAAPSAQ
jgi:hypothetical protein